MRTLAFIAGVMILTAGSALAESGPDNAGEPIVADSASIPPDLTGTWILNENLSDPFNVPAGRGGDGGGRRGGGGRGGGRGGGKGKGGGSQPSQEEMEQRQAEMQKLMEEMKQKVARMTIFQEGLEFNVTDGQDISHLLYTDGREMTVWTDRGQATGFAKWNGPSLVTRWRMEQDQPEHIRQFSLDPQTDRLTVNDTSTKPGSDTITTRSMVYDRHN